ncbi:hypothetical protein BC828DRAFT_435901 [Blastocladiella britannica]|nr:hypothetical protein BC828DRAFT_435901 [Blastocladiella britannica]
MSSTTANAHRRRASLAAQHLFVTSMLASLPDRGALSEPLLMRRLSHLWRTMPAAAKLVWRSRALLAAADSGPGAAHAAHAAHAAPVPVLSGGTAEVSAPTVGVVAPSRDRKSTGTNTTTGAAETDMPSPRIAHVAATELFSDARLLGPKAEMPGVRERLLSHVPAPLLIRPVPALSSGTAAITSRCPACVSPTSSASSAARRSSTFMSPSAMAAALLSPTSPSCSCAHTISGIADETIPSSGSTAAGSMSPALSLPSPVASDHGEEDRRRRRLRLHSQHPASSPGGTGATTAHSTSQPPATPTASRRRPTLATQNAISGGASSSSPLSPATPTTPRTTGTAAARIRSRTRSLTCGRVVVLVPGTGGALAMPSQPPMLPSVGENEEESRSGSSSMSPTPSIASTLSMSPIPVVLPATPSGGGKGAHRARVLSLPPSFAELRRQSMAKSAPMDTWFDSAAGRKLMRKHGGVGGAF